ncbi:glutathione transferase GST 23-like [Senna tora]|uniref:Glutathione transferase GST 23-like n=1 Tax=Senna tora TaxID=362788 RepID=A0A834ST07_9FABA|nr:glutathione transferase GST 23-like [Senna tora]
MCSNGDEKENGVKSIKEALEKIEEEIKGKKFFGGQKIGYLDLALGWMSYWLPIFEEVGCMNIMDPSKFSAINSWINNFLNHPLIKGTFPPRDKMIPYFQRRKNQFSSTSRGTFKV